MEITAALQAFAALSSETRLWALCLLVDTGPLSAGDIADCLGARQNTMSSHLKSLQAAGLINRRRQGRQVLYTADATTIAGLAAFLAKDCAARESRAPIADRLAAAEGDEAVREDRRHDRAEQAYRLFD